MQYGVMIAVALVGVIHIAIAVTEMFFWTNPKVHSRLGYQLDEAKRVAPIVANAGLYNSFIAAGLLWGACPDHGTFTLQAFFLTCVIIAGVFGALTLSWKTLILQTVPGVGALALAWYARSAA